MVSHLFYIYGETCSKYPWEVIVATVTLTVCISTLDQSTIQASPSKSDSCCVQEYSPVDMIVMTIIRCLAVLYSYYQFRNLQKLGSKYILGIAGLFTVISSFIFTTTLLNLLNINLADLKDAMFFFLLLIDLSKASMLARYGLSAKNENEIKENIAKGMAFLGPTMTLDTIVETLVIGIGTLSGVHRLEMLSYFACLSVIVNYIVFMTLYPSCLSLIIELSKKTRRNVVVTQCIEMEEKSNPVIQRVKIIMSIGLSVVHLVSRRSFKNETEIYDNTLNNGTLFNGYSLKWLSLCADHIVVLILLFALIVKLIFFENNDGFSSFSKIDSPKNQEIQVNTINNELIWDAGEDNQPNRNIIDCLEILKTTPNELTDKEMIVLLKEKHISLYNLEKVVKNAAKAVRIRRKVFSEHKKLDQALSLLPYQNFDYEKVLGACCENVIGYVPLPVGIIGPLKLDNTEHFVPMATTEGCLIASTSRGCKATFQNGITSRIVRDGMTRGPVVRFPSLESAGNAVSWIEQPNNFKLLKKTFDSTSNFARLKKITSRIAGRYLFVRFVASTGDAMGMNMLSKGSERSLKYMQIHFPEMEILSLSGNFCTDKKPAAINWIEGRGKSVVCEAIISSETVKTLLKTTSHSLIDVNISKNLIGSAMAGSLGGFNAHAANIVTAIFIATGQDPAQNVVSSNCITLMEPWGLNGEDLYISCTMPSIEVGTVGGGTILHAQSACLEMLGVKGSNVENPGENAGLLAKIICGTVLAGELSLLAALSVGHLVSSHLKHNRSSTSSVSN
ncbi:3-hydroxy-3-methylglutaryl-coenzyme A reductase-like [Onthophagus taurus]|uniref:3-hydroxy-3-methylglutaryl-coenzyme A reductase-like n=1 Tax=Onthophagus taurus TaxID=166361 RepID=UPI000C20CC6A|nr:3-hydroxy-3-methylglutaryl-coenzyme A reductase-like [Onthophagus taurus]